MAKIVFREKAIRDLNEIWNYTFEKWSEKQADKYYNDIKQNCYNISKNPNLGKRYSVINKNLMGLKSGKHIIFYQYNTNDEIEIIRILHGRMDITNRINE